MESVVAREQAFLWDIRGMRAVEVDWDRAAFADVDGSAEESQ